MAACLEVSVASPSGDFWSLCLPHNATGAHLKAKLAELTCVPARRQRLFCGHSELHAKRPLAQCVKKGISITFVVAYGNYSVLIAGGSAAEIRVTDTGECRRRFKVRRGALIAATISPDGSQVAMIDTDGGVELWSVLSGGHIASLRGHRRNVRSADFSPNGSILLTTACDDTARLWNLESRRCIAIVRSLDVIVGKFAPHSPEFVTAGGGDGVATLWALESDQIVREFCGHTSRVHSASFASSGLLLLTASADHTLRLWDKDTGSCIQTLLSHTASVLGAVFSPCGDFILSASADHTAKVWNTDSGECILTLRGHKGPVNSVLMSHDGLVALTASDDGTARMWSCATGASLYTLYMRGIIGSAAFCL